MMTLGGLFAWSFLVWVVLTWTLTFEQMVFGLVLAALVSVALGSLGRVCGPWCLLRPRRLAPLLKLFAVTAGKILVANLRLSARIWSPCLPLSSGMVLSATEQRSDGGLATVGLLTSLVVDNQIVDVDRRNHRLQYHAVAVPPRGQLNARNAINGPVEDLIEPLQGRRPERPGAGCRGG